MQSDIILNIGKCLYTQFRPLVESPKAAAVIFFAAEAINLLGDRLQSQKFVQDSLQQLSPRIKQVVTTTAQFAFNSLGAVTVNQALGRALPHQLALTLAALPILLHFVINLVTQTKSIGTDAKPIQMLSKHAEEMYQTRVNFQKELKEIQEKKNEKDDQIVEKVKAFATPIKICTHDLCKNPHKLTRENSIGFLNEFSNDAKKHVEEMERNSKKFSFLNEGWEKERDSQLIKLGDGKYCDNYIRYELDSLKTGYNECVAYKKNVPIYEQGIKDATALLAEFREAVKSYDQAIAEKRKEIKEFLSQSKENFFSLAAKSLQKVWPTSFNSSEEKKKACHKHSEENIGFIKKQRVSFCSIDDLFNKLDEKTYQNEIGCWERAIENALDQSEKENKRKAFYILKASLDREIMAELCTKRS